MSSKVAPVNATPVPRMQLLESNVMATIKSQQPSKAPASQSASPVSPVNNQPPPANAVSDIRLTVAAPAYKAHFTPALLNKVLQVHERFGPEVHVRLTNRKAAQRSINELGEDSSYLTTRSIEEMKASAEKEGFLKDRHEFDSLKSPTVIVTGTASDEGQLLRRQGFDRKGQPLSGETATGTLDDNEDATATSNATLDAHVQMSAAVRRFDKGFPVPNRFRVRSLHMIEPGVAFMKNGHPEISSGLLFDLSAHLYNNLQTYHDRQETLQLYIPKLRTPAEAKLVRDVIEHIKTDLGITDPRAVKVTLMVEAIESITQMDKMIEALGADLVTGINFGRWDLFGNMVNESSNFMDCPDRKDMGMQTPQLIAMQRRLEMVADIYNLDAEGGMSSVVLTGRTPEDREWQLSLVLADKLHELLLGLEKAWIAQPDPALIKAINSVFGDSEKLRETLTQYETNLNKIEPGLVERVRDFLDQGRPVVKPTDEEINTHALLNINEGSRTEAEVKKNLLEALIYELMMQLGIGAANIDGVMVDKAVQEIDVHLIRHFLKHNKGIDCDGVEKPIKDSLPSLLKEAKTALIKRVREGKVQALKDLRKDSEVLTRAAIAIEKASQVITDSIMDPDDLSFVTEKSQPHMLTEEQLEILKHTETAYPGLRKTARELTPITEKSPLVVETKRLLLATASKL